MKRKKRKRGTKIGAEIGRSMERGRSEAVWHCERSRPSSIKSQTPALGCGDEFFEESPRGRVPVPDPRAAGAGGEAAGAQRRGKGNRGQSAKLYLAATAPPCASSQPTLSTDQVPSTARRLPWRRSWRKVSVLGQPPFLSYCSNAWAWIIPQTRVRVSCQRSGKILCRPPLFISQRHKHRGPHAIDPLPPISTTTPQPGLNLPLSSRLTPATASSPPSSFDPSITHPPALTLISPLSLLRLHTRQKPRPLVARAGLFPSS